MTTEKAILIADDDDNDVVLLKRVLKAAKIVNPMHVVHNGEEAIHYLAGEGSFKDREKYPYPVLLLLNLQMPRRTGGEVLGWMQTQKVLPPLKVVVVTGHPDIRQLQQAHHLGAQSFLKKPPCEKDLVRMLETTEGLQLTQATDGRVLRLISTAAAIGMFLAKTVCAPGATYRL